MEFNTCDCILHLSDRYAMEVEYDGVHIMCKKTGAEVFVLVTDQFNELMKYKVVIAITLLAVRYKEDDIPPVIKELMPPNSTFLCELMGRVKVNVNPKSPHLRLADKYSTIELTKEEFGCIKWFDTMLKYYQ